MELKTPPESNVFLLSGFVGDQPVINRDDPSDDNIVLAYVVAESPEQAVADQKSVMPGFKPTGIVSLAELRRHVSELERVAAGEAPALRKNKG